MPIENLKIFSKNYPNIDFENAIIKPFGEGLINYSWIIEIPFKNEKFFLQRLNTDIFSNVDALEHNLMISKNFLKNHNFRLYFPIENIFGKMHTKTENGVFRLYEFAENMDTHQTPPSDEHIFSAAKKFAEFSYVLSPLADDFQETIPDFHNLSLRYADFEKILQKIPNDNPRKIFAKNEISEIQNLSWIVEKFENLKKILPKRVFHHDAKINNILFVKGKSEAFCPVDLDTIMSGYIFSDFGDMVWSLVFEMNHNQPKKYFFHKEKYQKLCEGYLSGFDENISENEIEAMHFGGVVMNYMLAIRFLTDFLNNDRYFKIQYENHNFDRAKWQIDATNQFLQEVFYQI